MRGGVGGWCPEADPPSSEGGLGDPTGGTTRSAWRLACVPEKPRLLHSTAR